MGRNGKKDGKGGGTGKYNLRNEERKGDANEEYGKDAWKVKRLKGRRWEGRKMGMKEDSRGKRI